MPPLLPAALNPGGRGAAGAIEGATGASEGSGGRGFGGVSGATDGRGGSSVSVPVEQGAGVARGFNLQFLSGEKKKSGKRKLQEDSPKSPTRMRSTIPPMRNQLLSDKPVCSRAGSARGKPSRYL